MTKKFELLLLKHPIKSSQPEYSRTVCLVYWNLTNITDEFDVSDIITFVSRLELEAKPFDSSYRGADYAKFASNDSYDLSCFFADKANELFLSIVCNNPSAKNKLAVLIKDLENLEQGNILQAKG